jgi:hypothetical protein
MNSDRSAFVRRRPGKYMLYIFIFALQNCSLWLIGVVNRLERVIGVDLNNDGWIGGMPYYPFGYSVIRRYHNPVAGYGIYQPYRYIY